jgi:hypothetical protein
MGVAPVVVVSPLISLMRDQLRALAETGIAAVAIHSAQDDFENAKLLEGLSRGRIKLLYVAPERLASESLIDMLRAAHIRLLAIDEAHCVSLGDTSFARTIRVSRSSRKYSARRKPWRAGAARRRRTPFASVDRLAARSRAQAAPSAASCRKGRSARRFGCDAAAQP